MLSQQRWRVSSSCYLHIKFSIVFTSAPLRSPQISELPLARPPARSFALKTSLNATAARLAAFADGLSDLTLWRALKIKELREYAISFEQRNNQRQTRTISDVPPVETSARLVLSSELPESFVMSFDLLL